MLISAVTVSGYFEQDVDELTKNLFENLRADPTLLGKTHFFVIHISILKLQDKCI